MHWSTWLVRGLANERINLKRNDADCLKNCTCRAYTDSKLTGGDSGCLMCFGDLIFVRRSLGNLTGQSVYIRVPASEPGIIVAFLKLIVLNFLFQ